MHERKRHATHAAHPSSSGTVDGGGGGEFNLSLSGGYPLSWFGIPRSTRTGPRIGPEGTHPGISSDRSGGTPP